MKIIFFGSDNFAVPSLEVLLSSGHNLSCVVTQPDKKKGRGLHVEGTAVKAFAKQKNLTVFQPQNVNSAQAISALKKLEPDLFVVLAYGQILSEEALSIPRQFCLNLHASILPKYRGAAPINWAIIKGEKMTGVTAMKMTKKMDAGPIIAQEKTEIASCDNAATLSEKLSLSAAGLLIKTLKSIEKGSYKLTPQEEKSANFAPKLRKADGLINWANSAQQINNLIRGLYQWPNAFTSYKNKLLKFYKASVFMSVEKEGAQVIPGQIIKVLKDEIIVSCGKGDLVIEELQLEGKRRMQTREFILGHKVSVGDMLG